LADSIPNLTTLVLSANNIAELADLDPLRKFGKLTHLSVMENPVVRKEVWLQDQGVQAIANALPQNYRYWLIWRIPSLRFLDFQKVKTTEREQANDLFGTASEPTALASKIMGIKSRTFDVGGGAANGRTPAEKNMRVKLTETEKRRVQELIKNAKTMQEISRIEKDLNEGRIPAGAADGDRMDM
jgi:U2 small nuclear ribonucleoprotein A'